MTFKKLFLFAAYLFCSIFLTAQTNTGSQQIFEDLVEEIAKGIDGEADYSQITDDLNYFLENLVNLNTANEETLEKLRILNTFQIKNLLNHIQVHGELATLYELQLVEGFDYTTIKKLLPFVLVSQLVETPSWNTDKAIKYGKHTLFERVSSVIEQQHGYQNVSDSTLSENPNKYYSGNPLHIYTRYQFKYKNKLQWGITAEKDAGEQVFKGNQAQGFDFYSAHFQVNDLGMLKTAILGDYQVQFGQGLIMWSYLSSGKSSNVMDIRKRGKGLHKYSSTDENAFLRGGGITIAKWGFEYTVFGSHKKIDANVTINDTLDEDAYFSSLLNTGIHATLSEIEDKDAIQETVYGSNLNWQHKNFKIGISGIGYQYSYPFKPDDSPENKYRFNGTTNSNITADAEFKFKSLHIFTEGALSENGGKALISGALMEFTSQLRASVLYRNYQKEYQALYSNAFAEGSRVQNEQGFYMGVDMNPVKKWKIAGYYDFYKFPWITSSADSPSKGNDFLVQADFTASRLVSMYWRYKHEAKESNSDEAENGVTKLGTTEKTSFRYQIAYSPVKNWEFRNRIELSTFGTQNNNKEGGYMLFQDVIYRPIKLPISVVLRYAIFDTESYSTRIYTYESDVLNASSVPPLFDKGTRTYLMLHYQLWESLDLWLRFSQTKYTNISSIGNDLSQITGNTKSEVKFQLRWQF